MTDVEPLRKLLEQFTYKPGWSFEIYRDMLDIRAVVIDSDDFQSLIPVESLIDIPRNVSPNLNFFWEKWLLNRIMDLERHEAQEFFKINGVKVFDPHKDNQI